MAIQSDNKGTIIYVGNFNIQNMNAAGKRVLANSILLKNIGYNVVLIGVDPDDKSHNCIADTLTIVEGLEIYSYPASLYINRRYNVKVMFHAFVTFVQHTHLNNIQAIIYYGSPSLALYVRKVQKYANFHNIKIVADVSDWMNVDTSSMLFYLVKSIDTYYKNAILNKRADGIIVISNWLKKYYQNSGKKILLVPPLTWRTAEKQNTMNDIPQIIYAGFPFRDENRIKKRTSFKDRLDLAVKFLAKVKEKKVSFKFHIFGLTVEQYLINFPNHKQYLKILGESIVFHGKVRMDDVQKEMSHMDYTILLREENRMTMAGFPTKVAESISMGVPVITTRTSDIEYYAIENETVFFVDITRELDTINRFMEILSLSRVERMKNKEKCISNNMFSIKKFEVDMEKYMKDLINI